MNKSKGSSEESIGRPAEWREGRYQQPGKPVDESVQVPADERNRSREPISTPVTRRDYEQGEPAPANRALNRWNVGSGMSRTMR